MLRQLSHIVLYITLVAVLLLNGTAHDFIHSFAHHEDTVHSVSSSRDDGQLQFEQEHHHCNYLNMEIPVYDAPSMFIPDELLMVVHNIFPEAAAVAMPGARDFSLSDRGPPVTSFPFLLS